MQYIDYMSNFSWSKKAFVKDVIQLDELVVIQDRKHWNKKMRYILQSQDLSFPYFLSRNSYYFCVLVFTGTGLIFSTVAGTMLCSGFRVKAEAVSHWCFHCCWAMPTQNQDISSSHVALAARRLGCTKYCEGTQPGQLIWAGQRVPCIGTKARRKEAGKCLWEWRCLYSQKTPRYEEHCFPRTGCTPACWFKVLNRFPMLPCLHTQLLLYLANFFQHKKLTRI